MKKISKNVLLVSSVGLAGSAFAVTNTHPVFAASNATTSTSSSQDVASAQTQVNEAQKEVDQTQSQLNSAEDQLSTANSDLDQKNADLQKAKKAVNDATINEDTNNALAQAAIDKAQSEVNYANNEYQDAVKENNDRQKDLTDAENDINSEQAKLDEIHKKNSDINTQIDSANSDINNYQGQINDLQKKKDELSPKLDAAQQALNVKQPQIDAATQNLQNAQKDLGEAKSVNEQFTLPESYINYVTGKSTDWDTAKKDLQDAVASHTYPFTDGDASDTVYNDPSALSNSDSKRLSLYVKNLIESIQSQVSSQNKLTITNGSLEYAKRYTQDYQNSNYVFRKYNAINAAATEMGINQSSVIGYDIAANRQVTGWSQVSINGYVRTYYDYGTTSMSEIAKAAFDLVTQELADPNNYKDIINNNGYFSVAVTTQDDKFYVCLLTINPSGVPSSFDTNEVAQPSQDEITTKEDAIKQAQAALDQAKNDASTEQSVYDQLQSQSQELDQQISDLQAKISDLQSSIDNLRNQIEDDTWIQKDLDIENSLLPQRKTFAQMSANKVQDTQANLNAAQAELASAKQNADTVKAELGNLKQKLQTAQQAYDSASKAQSDASKKVDSLKQQLETAKKKLAHAKAELVLAQTKQNTDNKQNQGSSDNKQKQGSSNSSTNKKDTNNSSSATKTTTKKATTKKATTKKATTKKTTTKKVKKAKKVVVASSKFTSLKGSKKAFVGSWKKAKSVSGYQVRYSTASSMAKSKTKSAKATKITVSSLKSKKKYYVQLRSYRKLSGKTYYSAWSKAKSVKTR
ncbi:SEC10/PgrA surface exclusion domain-containing protein [Lactobacillus nasalidis]|nr:SEC10/PgrA surface exclusion domain-containing protein [Lactobacillus nasalidis]